MKSNSRSGRTIVVGDIHGCYDELMDLLAVAKIATNDRIIAVGDLLSKGPKSAAVLDLFISDLRYSSVIGNHDLALVRYWRGERRRLTAAQRQTTNELEAHRNQYFSYLASLPLWI